MLISADCIESTSANGAITTDKGRGESSKSDKSTRLKKKKKLPSHRNMAQMNQSDHVYKVCKSLSKLTCNQTKISWKCFLEEILKVDSEVLPQNMVLIAKLNDISAKEGGEYKVLCNENDYLATRKIAKKKNCSFSIIVKYLKNEVFDKKNLQHYIEDILKPYSVHLAITVMDRSYVPKEGNPNITCSSNTCTSLTSEGSAISAVKDFISQFQENLDNLETYIDAVTSDGKKAGDSTQFDSVCTHCQSPISGTYYRCSVCPYFILCDKCEAFSDQVHTESHLFLKIKEKCLPTESTNLNETNSVNKKPQLTVVEPVDTSHNLLDFKLNESKSTSLDSKESSHGESVNQFSEMLQVENKVDGKQKTIYNVEAGSKITKIWKIRNNGPTPWNSHLVLRRISGNIEPIHGQYSLPVPLLKPGQDDVISITFKVPENIKEETNFFSVWRFCYKGKTFGNSLNLNTVVRPSQANLPIKKDQAERFTGKLSSSDEEDSVIFPPCFNLDVPFVPPSSQMPSAGNSSIPISQEGQEAKVVIGSTQKTSVDESKHSGSDHPSRSKNKSIAKHKMVWAKKFESLEQHKRAWQANVRTSNGQHPPPTLFPYPISDNDFVPLTFPEFEARRKAYLASRLNRSKDRKASDSKRDFGQGNTKLTKQTIDSDGGRKTTINQAPPPFSSKNYLFDVLSGRRALLEKEQLLPSISAIGNTVSSICNMIANPGPSNTQSSSNCTHSQNDSKDHLRDALQKLSEMGFCNEKLNSELLLKHNFDIQLTVQELFFSMGNGNSFSSSTFASNEPTATSASPSAAGPCQGQESQQQKNKAPSKSCFSVDGVD